jgi:hypothetical protein
VVASPSTQADSIRIVETAALPDKFALAEIRVNSFGTNTGTSINMVATQATDVSGVEYYFECTAGGGNDSGWQDSPVYTDTGLTPDMQYTYTVTARDKSAGQNTTAASAEASAITDLFLSCPYTCGDLDDSGGNIDMGDFARFASCWDEDPLINLNCVCANLVEFDDHIINMYDLSVLAELFLSSSPDYAPNCSTSITDPYAPSPDPMSFATVPYATSSSSIAMVATMASDVSGVEYYFTCTAGGGNDSDWQDSTSYEDTGLTPDTLYTYTVTASDLSVNLNETTPSSELSATTDPDVPADTVIITKAEWNDDPGKLELKVEATSSDQPSVTLTLVSYGTMTWSTNKYKYTEKPTANPGTITVTSSGGGSDSATVTIK